VTIYFFVRVGRGRGLSSTQRLAKYRGRVLLEVRNSFFFQITVNSLLRERSSRPAFRKHRFKEDIEMESPKDVAVAVAAIGRIEAGPTLLKVLCDITGMES
jgi:hypothetical protein